MRTIDSRPILWSVACIASALVANNSRAEVEVPLLLITNTWRYNAWGTNLPTTPQSWRATNYDDSWWLTGRPLFGYEDYSEWPLPILTRIVAPQMGGPLTTYFRTHFQYPTESTTAVTLVASNLLDDGAAFFINGAEVLRVRLPAGEISYSTLATNAPIEGAYEVFTVPATNVHRGDNLLAVELHQSQTTSPDDLFGMSLTAVWPDPIVITNQPASLTVAIGTPVTFMVGVTGSNPGFRWFKVGGPAVLSTTSSYSIANLVYANAGDYYVVITNILGSVTSQVATLTVVPDVYGPGLVSAVAQELSSSNSIFVTFTEAVQRATATNAANYVLTHSGTTNPVTITNVQHSLNTVTLRVSGPEWRWGDPYLLTVTNVADVRTNYTAQPTNQVWVTFPQEWCPMDSFSLYWDWVTAYYYRDPPADWDGDWRGADFNDRDREVWTPLQGVLYYAWTPPPCGPLNSPLNTTRTGITHYFRTHFTVPPNADTGQLSINYVIASGAVLYLNGAEIYRLNMPSGAIEAGTLALSSGTRCGSTPFLAVGNLHRGANVLAAEVHRPNTSDLQDLFYGVQIRGLIFPDPLAGR